MSQLTNTSGPTRLFRADNPHDVACAAIVAATLPIGRDILAFSTDKTGRNPTDYAQRMRTIACLHKWSAVVDISGLPLAQHMFTASTGLVRLGRIRDVIRSAQMLRRSLAPVFGLEPTVRSLPQLLSAQVDELYLNCFHHADVQLMYSAFPNALKIYYPHSFDSFTSPEAMHFAAFCYGASACGQSARDRLIDGVKRAVGGRDAVLPRRMRIDEAYSFKLPVEGVAKQHDLSGQMSRRMMERLFSQLPADIRDYYRALAEKCGSRAALLLMHPYDTNLESQRERQNDVVVELASRIVELERPSAILLKPHPRNSAEEVRSAVRRLGRTLKATPLEVVSEHREYPVEIVLFPFSIQTAGTLGSSAVEILRRIYKMKIYCPERAVLELYSDEALSLESIRAWIEEHRGDYIPV